MSAVCPHQKGVITVKWDLWYFRGETCLQSLQDCVRFMRFFSCIRSLLVFLSSQLHWVQSSFYVDGLWVLLILIFALDGMDQGSNYHTVVAVWWPTEAPEIVLPCSKNKVTDRFINWKGDARMSSPNVVCYISEIQCGEMIKQRLLNPYSTW